MKTIMLASTLVFAMTLSVGAQGIHLSAGETLSIGFNGVDGCHSTEPTFTGGTVSISFLNNILVPGEELFLEMFEDDLSEPPVASRFYSPAEPVAVVGLASPSSWLDYQGLVRISMLSGSVDISYAHFFVNPDRFTYCDTVVLVPEPSTHVLLTLGGILSASVLGYRHAGRRGARKLH